MSKDEGESVPITLATNEKGKVFFTFDPDEFPEDDKAWFGPFEDEKAAIDAATEQVQTAYEQALKEQIGVGN